MEIIRIKSILMKLKLGVYTDESWFIRSAGCSLEELEEMVSLGLLLKKDKDPTNFMSDNQYCLTKAGYDLTWNS